MRELTRNVYHGSSSSRRRNQLSPRVQPIDTQNHWAISSARGLLYGRVVHQPRLETLTMLRQSKTTMMMLAASGMLSACVAQPMNDDADDAGGVVQSDDGKEDAIGNYEAPETLVPGASRRLASNIVGADVGK